MLHFQVNKSRLSTTMRQLTALKAQVPSMNKQMLLNVKSGLNKRLAELRSSKTSLVDRSDIKSLDKMSLVTQEESAIVDILTQVKLFLF
jgi:hypothetical protein